MGLFVRLPGSWLILLIFIFTINIVKGQTGNVSGTISDQFGTLPGAKITVEGTPISVSTDVNGNYSFDLAPGIYDLSVNFVMYLTGNSNVIINAGDSLIVNFTLEPGFSIDQPISIGARVKPRTLFETTVPIDIISPQEIENSGQTELGQLLHYLVPSFHSTHQTISDGTDMVDPATLRGLGPDQVLVLINGKRRHSSALVNVNGTVGRGSVSTDLNSIPLAAVDRIELLRDGAAAQYGSDAIAGVINIILKEQTNILNFSNHIGVNTEGDGFTSSSAVNFGFGIGERGFLNITGEFRDRNPTNRSGTYTGTVFSDDPTEDQQQISSTNFFGNTGYDDNRVMEVGHSGTQNLGFFFNGDIPITNSASIYFQGGRNFREGFSHGFYRFPKNHERVVPEIYPLGFSPRFQIEIQDDAITAGVRGVNKNWNLDFSHTIAKNQFDINLENTNNASLGVASPTRFYSGGFRYTQNITNLDVSRAINRLEGINIGFGAELRVESYEINPGDEFSWADGGEVLVLDNDTIRKTAGAQVFPGFQPANELIKFRTNKAIYGDIEARMSSKFILGTAARYESYSDFGDQAIWKLSSRYTIADGLSASLGYSTGFRAPSLQQVYFNNISTQFVNGDAVQVGTFNNESAVTEAFGIEQLKPELSNHFTAGLVAKSGKLTFQLDYYYTQITNRIVLSGRFGAGYEDILDPLGVGAAQFFTNAVDTNTEGVDARLTYQNNLGSGNLAISVGANASRTELNGEVNVSDQLEGQEDVLFNREEISRIESAQPNFKVIANASYKYRSLTVNLGNTYFGRVEYIHPSDANSSDWVINDFTDQVESRDQVFDPKLITDLSLAWKMNEHMKWFVGGNNILNVYPDKHQHSANVNNGLFVYSRRVQQFGVRGSYVYLRLLLSL